MRGAHTPVGCQVDAGLGVTNKGTKMSPWTQTLVTIGKKMLGRKPNEYVRKTNPLKRTNCSKLQQTVNISSLPIQETLLVYGTCNRKRFFSL